MKTSNRFFPILVFAGIGILGNLNADSTDYLSRKGALLERLDSIDMEKQMRKRKGLSLEELEAKSLIVKDSIAALKKGMRSATAKPK